MALAPGRQAGLLRCFWRNLFSFIWNDCSYADFPSLGRVYAAYGGIFIILSVLWGWGVDRKTPDIYDWAGSVICLVGVSVMLFAPRQ